MEMFSEYARDYKAEYKKFQSSPEKIKYRAELNKHNREKGTYGNGDKLDASHKDGKIVGFEDQSKNRGRAEKSRLKKSFKEYAIDVTIGGRGQAFSTMHPTADLRTEPLNASKDKLTYLKLLNKALRTMPGSPKQKDIIKQINVYRKKIGQKPLTT